MDVYAEQISPERLRQILPAQPESSASALTAKPVQIDCYADYGPAELDVPALDHHFLLLQTISTTRFTQQRAGQTFESPWRPGDLSLMPAGQPSQWAWNSPTGTLQVYVPTGLIRGILEDASGLDGSQLELTNRFRFHDPLLCHLGMALRGQLRTGGILGSTYVEGLTHALVLGLISRHSTRRFAFERAPERRLPADRLRKVRDLIEARVAAGESPSLPELAAAAHYSVYHFVRLFKASTGLAPHRYIQERRLERARGLLIHSQMPMKEIARLCGYADQGHFSRAFKIRFGAPPTAARGNGARSSKV